MMEGPASREFTEGLGLVVSAVRLRDRSGGDATIERAAGKLRVRGTMLMMRPPELGGSSGLATARTVTSRPGVDG